MLYKHTSLDSTDDLLSFDRFYLSFFLLLALCSLVLQVARSFFTSVRGSGIRFRYR